MSEDSPFLQLSILPPAADADSGSRARGGRHAKLFEFPGISAARLEWLLPPPWQPSETTAGTENRESSSGSCVRVRTLCGCCIRSRSAIRRRPAKPERTKCLLRGPLSPLSGSGRTLSKPEEVEFLDRVQASYLSAPPAKPRADAAGAPEEERR